jgi:alkylated DNA repair protein (DNA oxidative demethylase)
MKPEGLTYQPDVISIDEEKILLDAIAVLPFQEVRMHGVVAKRAVIHYGWDYDYEGWSIHPSDPIPDFLMPLVNRCAEFAGIDVARIEQLMVARYPPGAAIGWHRDAPMFGSPVIGISLGTACVMRFRRGKVRAWETFNQTLEPRSLYVLGGPARVTWQHSIPRTPELRYSVTLRTLRRDPRLQPAQERD